jgi:two-component system cell cycle sensor histidine kinase/response regulator CckA
MSDAEEMLRLVVEEAPVGMVIVDADGRIRLVNKQVERLFGYARSELLGRSVDILVPERVRSGHPGHRAGYLVESRPLPPGMGRDDLFGLRKDGTEFPADIGLNRIRTAEGTLVMASIIDVTERKQVEAALRESEERFRLIVEGIQESFILQEIITNDGGEPVDVRYLMINPAAEKGLGRKPAELLGRLRSEVQGPLDGETSAFLRRVLESRNAIVMERPDAGTGRWEMVFAYSPRPGQVATLSLDVTERKVFEQKMQQTQKMETLGVLAEGIAHDFNNILQAISGNAEVALGSLTRDSKAYDCLQGILHATRRASDLTRQMIAYSGRESLRMEPLDLNRVISDIEEILRSSVSRNAQVVYQLAPGLPAIEADRSQVQQVVAQLFINASEALEEAPGSIRLSTGTVDCDDHDLTDLWGEDHLEAGTYVFLEVTDSGRGMDERTRQRIFEPFFTTKFMGRGLGLAAVMGIVRGHKGAIKVRSEPGRGATISVLFPSRGITSEGREKPPMPR